jgi:hypothetical protein
MLIINYDEHAKQSLDAAGYLECQIKLTMITPMIPLFVLPMRIVIHAADQTTETPFIRTKGNARPWYYATGIAPKTYITLDEY